MEMGRTVVYPAPRCNVTWLGGERNNRLPLDYPLQYRVSSKRSLLLLSWCNLAKHVHVSLIAKPVYPNHAAPQYQVIPYAPRGFDDSRCMLGGYLMQGCMAARWWV